MTANKIYKKLATIQGKIKGLKRGKENKHQKYFYFTEEQAIKELKPLLDAEKLAVVFKDDQDPNNFFYQYDGKNHILRYLKKAIINDGENEPLIFTFWAMGQDSDISKAKGKGETYAIKYFLSKFFMIPIEDELDPDQEKAPKAKEATPTARKETAEETAERLNAQAKADEFLKKHGLLPKDKEKEEEPKPADTSKEIKK